MQFRIAIFFLSEEHGLSKLIEFQKKQNITISKEDMVAYLGITSVESLDINRHNIKQMLAVSTYFLLSNFFIACSVTGVNKFTKFPSGSRNKSDLFPQGIVVGF